MFLATTLEHGAPGFHSHCPSTIVLYTVQSLILDLADPGLDQIRLDPKSPGPGPGPDAADLVPEL